MIKGLLVALVLSVLGNALLLYRIFDMGVAMTYESDELARRESQLSTVQLLLPHLVNSATRSTIRSAAKAAGLEVLDKRDDNLYVGEVQFVFKGDAVMAIKFD